MKDTEWSPTQPADHVLDGRDDNERKVRAAVGTIHRAFGALHARPTIKTT